MAIEQNNNEPIRTDNAAEEEFSTQVAAKPASRKTAKRASRQVSRQITDNIVLYSDGKMRWQYDLDLFRTPVVFWLVWRILAVICAVALAIVFFVDCGKPDFFWQGFLQWLKILAIAIAGVTALCGLGYLVYAAMMGGKYSVIFEMDEKGINHIQTKSSAQKSRRIASATQIAGLAGGSPTTLGAGINASRTEMYTDFARVKRVIARPMFHLIKLSAPFNHNQVYVHKEDFAFVKDYIVAHCPSKKAKENRNHNAA